MYTNTVYLTGNYLLYSDNGTTCTAQHNHCTDVPISLGQLSSGEQLASNCLIGTAGKFCGTVS